MATAETTTTTEGETEAAETEVIYYRDAHGFKQELRVSKATARGIHAIRRKYVRDILKWRDHHVSFEDLTSRATERQPDPAEAESYARIRQRTELVGGANPWEGPRFSFLHYLGENATWPLPEREDGKCPACRDRRLTFFQACLWCNRTGRDVAIPKPTPIDLKRRRLAKPREDDGLAGGMGKPAAKAKKAPTEKQLEKQRLRQNALQRARRKAKREFERKARRLAKG